MSKIKKYSNKLKYQAVKEYLDGKGSYRSIAKKDCQRQIRNSLPEKSPIVEMHYERGLWGGRHMFNQTRLEELLVAYKQKLATDTWWNDEKYKWEAVKAFQDNWNEDAADFADMLSRSLAKTNNMLASANKYAKTMIIDFARKDPILVRSMFRDLFDESKEIFERIKNFKSQSSGLLKKYLQGKTEHFQDENTITVYLWLRFPDKYYIYKFSVAKRVSEELESDYAIEKGKYEKNIHNYLGLYNSLNQVIKEDGELSNLLQSKLTDDCYPDPELKTLTQDFSYYVKKQADTKDSHREDKNNPADAGMNSRPSIAQDGVKRSDFEPDENFYDKNKVLADKDQSLSSSPSIAPYAKNDFLQEVYMSEKRYEKLVAILRNKKNIILQGAPGVGKTFAARRLAWSMMGEKDDNRIDFVQFHQNYSYEDFVMGYKPDEHGFTLRHGIFYNFCQKAVSRPDQTFFFIIDEINRGNLSKIFGELLVLIEKSYRGTEMKLAYNGEAFSVPPNLYLIGLMNTADRSLAMLDYALRRRFVFYDMKPGFETEGFLTYQASFRNPNFAKLIQCVKELNVDISLDPSLGEGFCLGHSYFCNLAEADDAALTNIVEFELLPLLREYWFDDWSKYDNWQNKLEAVFQDRGMDSEPELGSGQAPVQGQASSQGQD